MELSGQKNSAGASSIWSNKSRSKPSVVSLSSSRMSQATAANPLSSAVAKALLLRNNGRKKTIPNIFSSNANNKKKAEAKIICLCAPATHPGSFRCCYHRTNKPLLSQKFPLGCSSSSSSSSSSSAADAGEMRDVKMEMMILLPKITFTGKWNPDAAANYIPRRGQPYSLSRFCPQNK